MQRLKPVLKWGLILVVIAGLVWGGTGLLSKQTRDTEASDFSQVVTVERGALTASITPTGEVIVKRRADLNFDVSGTELIELLVKAGQQVKKGDVLARIESAELERALDQAEADLLSAEETLEDALAPCSEMDRARAELAVATADVALEQARQDLEELLSPDPKAAKRAVCQAEYNLESARLNLTITRSSAQVGKKVRDLQYAVAWHERDFRNLQTKYEQGKINQETLDEKWEELDNLHKQLEAAEAAALSALVEAEDRVTEAEEALAEAREEELAELEVGPDELTLAQAESRLAQAEYNLAKAQDDFATILAGPKPKDSELAQARYDTAKAKLEEAQEALENATMVAPFDGTVISTGAKVGDLVSSSRTIVTVADLEDMEITAWIDETNITKVKAGQKATITFDAFVGLHFQGEVLEVPLEGSLKSNVVTYEVPVSLEGTKDVGIIPGMTANLTIIVGRTEDALLVSALAIQQGEDGNVVVLQDTAGSYVVTPVQVGLSNGMYVEIHRGLNEGDQVLVQYQIEEADVMFGMRNMGGMISPAGGSLPGGVRPGRQ